VSCRYAKCRVVFIVMLNVIMLSVAMLNVVILSVVMLSVETSGQQLSMFSNFPWQNKLERLSLASFLHSVTFSDVLLDVLHV
jgi:hypothetical protein